MTADVATGLRVLVVEDQADLAAKLALLLHLAGHEVDVAPDGPTALAKERDFAPDAVLLDLGLPGLSGFDVARELAGRRPRRTPLLVAVTGLRGDEARRQAAEAGIDLFLTKPVEPEALRRVLERFGRVIGGSATAEA